MSDILYIVGGLVVLVAAFLVLYVVTKPATFRIQRSATINAPAERVQALIADFRSWSLWSPWEKIDPAMKRDYGGAPTGPGATYAWEGNPKIGAGRMEILQVDPARILIQLDFIRPMKANNMAEFHFEASGGGTRVTWTMHGPNRCMGKLMGLFMDFDKMVGKSFDEGLAAMKQAAEA